MSSFITTYLGEHGQITLPADFIKANRLELGDTLNLIQADHQLIVIPEKNRAASSRNPREILLQQAGAFSDDKTFDELRNSIYAQRGRPETE